MYTKDTPVYKPKYKPQVLFFRTSSLTIYRVVNDMKFRYNSITIDRFLFSVNAEAASAISLSYNIIKDYINDDYEIIYVNQYIPNIMCGYNYLSEDNYTKFYKSDTFFQLLSTICIERKTKIKYFVTGYNAYMSAIELNIFYDYKFLIKLRHKTSISWRSIWQNENNIALILSDVWPRDCYLKIKNDAKLLFPWLTTQLQNDIKNTMNKNLAKTMRYMLGIIAWMQTKQVLNTYFSYDSGYCGLNVCGFKIKPIVYQIITTIHALEDEINLCNDKEQEAILRVQLLDLQEYMLTKINYNLSHKVLYTNQAAWIVQHMPPSQIYLKKPKCLSPSKTDIIKCAKNSKFIEYSEEELEKLHLDYVSSMKCAEEIDI